MLFVTGHGKTIAPDDGKGVYGKSGFIPVAQACGYTDYSDYQFKNTSQFGYLFPDASVSAGGQAQTGALDALGNAMIENMPKPSEDSSIPPIFTYLGQFIDHDVTANTDRETGFSVIDNDAISPVPRDKVQEGLANLRAGSMNLDSMYGGGAADGPLAKKMRELMRFPSDPAKMWLGKLTAIPGQDVPLPDDIAGDLLRIGRVLEAGLLSEDDLRNLPEELRKMFVNEDGSIRVQRALIGDARNDENLAVAQVHLAFLRLHNVIVDEAHKHVDDPHDREAVFTWARKMTTWHYQWLVINAYLPAICDADVLAQAINEKAPIYAAFFKANTPEKPALMPMPLEFSVSAFRFGHSMARSRYDWNRHFGRPADGGTPLLDRASFRLLFRFTGGSKTPMSPNDQPGAPTLPSNWPVEWDRFALPVSGDFPDRSARAIDTQLAEPLSDLSNEDPGIFRHLARRNLRRGLRLNIASAQDSISIINAAGGIQIPVLTQEQLCSGPTGDALGEGELATQTPLWFYVLKEAEVLGKNGKLGPLGSVLVADTLSGLVINDPDSYWNAESTDADAIWGPQEGVKPDGQVIDNIPNMLRAAGLL